MRRKPLKRILIWSGLVAVVLVVAVFVLPRAILAPESAREELVARIEALTGAPVAITGDVRYSILPHTRLVANDITIGADVGLTINRIIADFDPIDALLGRARIARIVLVRPERRMSAAVAAVSEAGRPATETAPARQRRNAAAMIHDLEEMARNAIARLDQLQILVIRNGVWRSAVDAPGINGVSNANLTITRASSLSAFRMEGGFTWNGQPTEIDLQVVSTKDLEDGGTSEVSLDFASPPLSIDFDGQVAFGSTPRLSGRFQGHGDSFSRLAAWLSDARFDIPDLGSLDLAGDVSLAGRTLAFTNARIDLASSSGVGALEYNLDRDRVDGTLAFETLDLTQIAEAIVPLPAGPFGMVRPIDASFAQSAELALRLSAETARLGSVSFQDAAAVITVADGAVALELGNAELYGGRAYGRVALDDSGAPNISGELNGFGVDLANLASATGIRALGVSGRGEFHARLQSPANDWRTILHDGRSQVKVTARNGVLSGFDPVVFSQPGVASIYTGLTGGTLPFDRLDAEFRTHGARLTLDNLSMRNTNYDLATRGDVLLPSGEVDLTGTSEILPKTASSDRASGEFTTPKPIRFTVNGTWPEPSITTLPPPLRSEQGTTGTLASDP